MAMERIKPAKKCPKCGGKSLRKIYSEKTGEFVGYQCKSKSCYHWWEPNPNTEAEGGL